jgi:hypothetical protein
MFRSFGIKAVFGMPQSGGQQETTGFHPDVSDDLADTETLEGAFVLRYVSQWLEARRCPVSRKVGTPLDDVDVDGGNGLSILSAASVRTGSTAETDRTTSLAVAEMT